MRQNIPAPAGTATDYLCNDDKPLDINCIDRSTKVLDDAKPLEAIDGSAKENFDDDDNSKATNVDHEPPLEDYLMSPEVIQLLKQVCNNVCYITKSCIFIYYYLF